MLTIEDTADKLIIYKYYKCSKQHSIVEALLKYLCIDYNCFYNPYWFSERTLLDIALSTVENIELTTKNVSREFLLDIIERNLEWIDKLNLKNRVQNAIENKQIDSMIKSIDEM